MRFTLLIVYFFGMLWSGVLGQTSENRSEGILEPKGTYTGLDGVTIDAKFAVFEGNQQVFIERVNNTSGLPPISSVPSEIPVTPYYRVGSTKEFSAGTDTDEYLLIRVPWPDGVSTNGIGVFTFAKAGQVETDPPTTIKRDTWFSSSATYVPETKEVIFAVFGLNPEGLLFTLAPDIYSEPQVSTGVFTPLNHEDATFGAICRQGLFNLATRGESCGQDEINQATQLMEDFYDTYHNQLGFPTPWLSPRTFADGTVRQYVVELRPESYNDYDTFGTLPASYAAGAYYSEPNAQGQLVYRTWVALPLTEAREGTFWHESFHAVQQRYYQNIKSQILQNPTYYSNGAWVTDPNILDEDGNPSFVLYKEPRGWFIEGTAALSRASGTTITLTEYYKDVNNNNNPRRRLDLSLYDTSNNYEYQTQDFWEAAARLSRTPSNGQGMGFLQIFFDSDPTTDEIEPYLDANGKAIPAWDPRSVDAALKAQSTFTTGGLKEAYYEYVRDALGGSSSSGGGYNEPNRVCSSCSFDASLFDPNTPYQEISLNSNGGATIDATLNPLSTKVYRIALKPGQTL